MSFRNGSPRHVLAGKVFVASLFTMGALAVYLAIVRHQPNNIGGGILTFYLIGTAWLTAMRRDGETSRFDWVALLIVLRQVIVEAFTKVKHLVPGKLHQQLVYVRREFTGPNSRNTLKLSNDRVIVFDVMLTYGH